MASTKEKLIEQQTLQERCLQSGIRMTNQRRLLANVLDDSDDHPDVDTIYQRCKAKDKFTSIASVCIELWVFSRTQA